MDLLKVKYWDPEVKFKLKKENPVEEKIRVLYCVSQINNQMRHLERTLGEAMRTD